MMKYAVSRITLDIQDTSSPITLSAKQGDSMREIICGFRDDSGQYNLDRGCAVVFTAKKPSGNLIYNECTVEGNFARYQFTAQTVSEIGPLKCEFKIYDDLSKPPKLTSPRFMINVEAPVFNDGDIPESSYEFLAVQDIVKRTTEEYLEQHPTITDTTLSKEDFAADAKAVGDAFKKVLSKSGGEMSGNLDMGGNLVTGLAIPSSSDDAANKGYVDGKHFTADISLSATGWAMSGGVYSQTVQVDGILETDRPHYGVVYSGTEEEMIAQKDAYALLDDLETAVGSVTVYCFDGKPDVDLNIQMEVNR